MAAVSLAQEGGALASRRAQGLEGNLCRCTGYRNIVAAVLAGSAEMAGAGDPRRSPTPADRSTGDRAPRRTRRRRQAPGRRPLAAAADEAAPGPSLVVDVGGSPTPTCATPDGGSRSVASPATTTSRPARWYASTSIRAPPPPRSAVAVRRGTLGGSLATAIPPPTCPRWYSPARRRRRARRGGERGDRGRRLASWTSSRQTLAPDG